MRIGDGGGLGKDNVFFGGFLEGGGMVWGWFGLGYKVFVVGVGLVGEGFGDIEELFMGGFWEIGVGVGGKVGNVRGGRWLGRVCWFNMVGCVGVGVDG